MSRRLFLPLLVLPLLVSCGGDGASSDLPPPDHNVVLIVIDTMGARYVGAHTPGLENSPTIDRLAREGVHFTRAYSTAPWTQPAVASLITSQMPSQHGVRHIFHELQRRETTLAEHLKQRGLATAGVISHFVIGDDFGYGQGFDLYDDSPVGDHRSITSADVTDQAIAALDRVPAGPSSSSPTTSTRTGTSTTTPTSTRRRTTTATCCPAWTSATCAPGATT